MLKQLRATTRVASDLAGMILLLMALQSSPVLQSAPVPTAVVAAGPRLLFVDNIRAAMILLVLSMHASDTYSPFGNWYFTDRSPVTLPTEIFFGAYQSFLQAFFMALLFFVSGYFSAPALDRKGTARFIHDRAYRLGIPTLLYMLAIGPLTQYFLSHTWGSGGFAHQWLLHIEDGEWLSETGPMWFCAALLAFSIAYALAREGWGCAAATALPRNRDIALFLAVMALATFVVRIFIPESVSILNMHFGDFAQYVLMFAAGIIAFRGRWLERLPERRALRWSFWTIGLSVPLFAILVVAGGALHGQTAAYNGGFKVVSAGKCFWEAMVCVGVSLGLIALFRRFFDAQGAAAKFLSDNAFAVYLFHPPILIALALLIHPVALPAIPKALLLTLLAATATFALSAAAFRKLPLLKRIL
jgi:fucose 4-O-acetylase-like acetyltransferase